MMAGMAPSGFDVGQSYGTLDPLRHLIDLLHGISYSQSLSNQAMAGAQQGGSSGSGGSGGPGGGGSGGGGSGNL